MSINSVAFVETRDQCDAVVRYTGRNSSSPLIIPVSPEADYIVDLQLGTHQTIEDFCSESELVKLGDLNIRIIEELADEFDAVLARAAADLPRHSWVSLRSFFHPLKGFLDSLVHRTLPLVRAFDTLKPSCVVCFFYPEYRVHGLNLMDKPALSMTSHIVPLVALAKGVSLEWMPVPDSKRERQEVVTQEDAKEQFVQHTAAQVLLVLKNLIRHAFGFSSRLVRTREGERQETALLVHSISGDLGGMIEQIWRARNLGEVLSFPAVFPDKDIELRKPACREVALSLWKEIQESETIRRHFIFEGINLFPLALSLLEIISLKGIPDLLAFAPVAEKSLRKVRRGVIITGGMVGRNSVIGKAADELGIPLVSIHYGGFLGYCVLPFHERYDLANADYFICNGEGAVKTLEKPSSLTYWNPSVKRAKPVAMGAPWVEDIVKEQRENKAIIDNSERGVKLRNHKTGGHLDRTIMYIMSALVGDNRYLGYVHHPEIWYWRLQRDLVQVMSRFSDVRVLLKPPMRDRYPQIRNPLFDWVEKNRPQNIQVMGDVRLESVLDLANAFIADSPSTPLLSLVATEKPFILYAESSTFKLVPEAARLLRKRAVLAETQDHFFAEVERLLAEQDWTLPKPVNDEFLIAYGTYAGDGRSAERCSNFLHDLAVKNRI